jgi:hypothetical protein
MINTRFAMVMQRSLRRSQSGQSIVILALGFVGLLAFVGIVTDVSLMFVRYSTLTRAVDAASIAAAGQVRRQIPFQSEINDYCTGVDANGAAWSPSNPCPAAEAAAFARSFGNVGVAARQFIEFYGLDPSAVLIDMCFTVSTMDPTTRQLVPLNPDVEDDFEELCVGATGRNSDRKLIKVTADIESPTVFLHLLGFSSIPLRASSISETAVLDVVLIMDVSESMLDETNYDTWAAEGYTKVYVPPDIYYFNYHTENGRGDGVGFGVERDHNFADLPTGGFMDYAPDINPDPFPGNKWYHFRYALSQKPQDEVYSLLCSGNDCNLPSGFRNPFEIQVFDVPGTPPNGPTKPLRIQCQVAYFPYASMYYPNVIGGYLDNLYKEIGLNGGDGWVVANRTRDAFVPAYDYYRCCNDPDGDGLFTDLLCEPFRETRRATEQFLQRIDFLRGDRVAFVTFDQRAFLVRRETEPGSGVYTHMIDNEDMAINTLNDFIGVRAEPSFYQPTVLGDGTQVLPWVMGDNYGKSELLGEHDYEARNSCSFQDAALEFPFSPSSSPGPGNPYGLPYDPFSHPYRLMPDAFAGVSGGQRMYPRGPEWESVSGYSPRFSYDLRAACGGGNIGAALREGSNALVDPFTTRTNGSVWVMVLLSDGASGASDPVFDTSLPGGPGTEPPDLYYPYNPGLNTFRITYGGLGLCPAGSPGSPTELTQFSESPYEFPFCSDEIPETRHFCFDPNKRRTVNGESINLYVDLGENCDRDLYDVDDYAHDWADWIGLSEPPGLTGTSQRNMTQLPTIFTIGFGMNFKAGTVRCKQGEIKVVGTDNDAANCLGEELLRYIADVGDNFRIDSDYQQALLENRAGVIGSMTDDDFGPRGECEEELPGGLSPTAAGFNNLIRPKPAGTSCGNYYNAPTTAELGRVFDDIASRMFTRLTQ